MTDAGLISAKAIASIRPGQVLRDPQVPGLHVRAGTRAAAWFLYYRNAAGAERRPKLGDVRVLSIPQAREIARAWLAKLASGIDPAAERDSLSQRPTMQDLAAKYAAEHAGPKKKPRSARQDSLMFDRYILPHFGAKTAVADVTKAEWVALHHSMRSTPYMANRVAALGRKAFNLAESWGWRPDYSNPVRVERFKEKRRRRVPTAGEAAALLKAIDEMRPDHPAFVGFIDLLCFTGARPREILTAKRAWVKSDGLHLPDSKVGARVIPLNEYARAAIKAIPIIVGNPYLIPSRRGRGHLVEYKKNWRDLCDRAGIKYGKADGGLIVYDLRRFFASAGVSAGLTLESVMQLMGHTQAQTTRGYAFLLQDSALAAATAAGDAMAKRRGSL